MNRRDVLKGLAIAGIAPFLNVGCGGDLHGDCIDFKVSDLPKDTQHNIVINCEDGRDMVYVNGVLIGEINNSYQVMHEIMQIGYPEGGYIQYELPTLMSSFSAWVKINADGTKELSMVRIYNKELSKTDIKYLLYEVK